MSLPCSALLVTVMKGLGGKEVLNLCRATGNYAKPSSNLISNWFSLSYTLGVTWKKSLKGGMTFWGQCAFGVCQFLIEMRTTKPQLSCSVIKGKVKPPVCPLTSSLSADGYLWCWAAWWWCLQKCLGEKKHAILSTLSQGGAGRPCVQLLGCLEHQAVFRSLRFPHASHFWMENKRGRCLTLPGITRSAQQADYPIGYSRRKSNHIITRTKRLTRQNTDVWMLLQEITLEFPQWVSSACASPLSGRGRWVPDSLGITGVQS